jgi:hypothetical protein
MITYNSKIITYMAFALLGYLFFQKYSEYKSQPSYLKQGDDITNSLNNFKPKYKMEIDHNKKYADYTLLEKFAYRFVKDDLPQGMRQQIESSPHTKKDNHN